MNTCVRTCAALFISLIAGCAVLDGSAALGREDIARIASVNVERSVRIRPALAGANASEERNLLDAGISQDLYYMQSAEKGLLLDQTYTRQRARSVSLLKKEWLRSPPFALEEQTKEYIESVCAQTKNCPTGDLRAKR